MNAFTMRRLLAASTAAVLLSAVAAGAKPGAGRELPPGADAPAIELRDLEGTPVSTSDIGDRVLVLVFGEVDHEGTVTACERLGESLGSPRLAGAAITPLLIVAHGDAAADLPEETRRKLPALILQDPARSAFGAYRVVVLPTVVVVDPEGKVVHAMPGFSPRFGEIVVEAVATAAGLQDAAALEQSLHPQVEPPADPEQVRADRLVHLGDELSKHGLDDLAVARYAEAIRIQPGHVKAILGLAAIQSRQGRLEEAESLYRSVLASHPDQVDASLGLAALQVRRGGEALDQAEGSVRAVLEANSGSPLAHYLLGQIYEERGSYRDAAAEYRRAAELLLAKK